MAKPLSDAHAASLPGRVRAILARAGTEEGLAQLQTLSVASQMLREQLDAVDQHLLALLARAPGEDRVVTTAPPPPHDLIATLSDIAEHLG